MTTQTELNSAVLLLEAAVTDLDSLLSKAEPDQLDLAASLTARSILVTTKAGLGQCAETLDNKLGEAMGTYKLVVEGHGQVERHKRTTRRNWDHDGLLRLVLDTRLINEDTGEIESDVDKIRAVWNLPGYSARTSVLKARGIDASEFCETEVRGWQLKVT